MCAALARVVCVHGSVRTAAVYIQAMRLARAYWEAICYSSNAHSESSWRMHVSCVQPHLSTTGSARSVANAVQSYSEQKTQETIDECKIYSHVQLIAQQT
jgi:hypothetical protein